MIFKDGHGMSYSLPDPHTTVLFDNKSLCYKFRFTTWAFDPCAVRAHKQSSVALLNSLLSYVSESLDHSASIDVCTPHHSELLW